VFSLPWLIWRCPCFTIGPQSEASTLLLYTLLHGSKSFQGYVLLRSDPETLLVPLLQQLYKANKRRANHLYMLQVTARLLRDRTCQRPGLLCTKLVPSSLDTAVPSMHS